MFNVAEEMTPTERAFVRAYATALLRNKSLVHTTISLMRPDALAVADVVTAAKAAVSLCQLDADFVDALSAVATKNSMPEKSTIKKYDAAQTKLLLDLFGLSFFQLVLSGGEKAPPKKNTVGWFSGKPEEWSFLIAKLNDAAATAEKNKLSPLLSSLLKFFNLLTDPPAGASKIWPPYSPYKDISGLFMHSNEEFDDWDDDADDAEFNYNDNY